MECNKPNCKIRYAIFKRFEFKSNFECVAKSNEVLFISMVNYLAN